MELNHFTETFTVLNADGDFRRMLKPSALFRYVEQAAADHARAYDMDDAFFAARHTAFLVGKQALKFDRVPQRAETLTLTSRAQVSKHGSVKRITTLTDAEGKEVAMVDCRWIVASLAEGRILREPGWTVENFWNDTVEDELPLQLHKCKDGLTSAGEWTAHYSQCDLNGHLNNAFYLDLVCDALPLEVMRKGPVTFASINYHREIPMGETAEVFYAPSADGWYVGGRREEHMAFECYLEFADEGAQKV